MPGVGTRDSFKQEVRRKSRIELFADLLEALFITIKDLGLDPMAVVAEVNERARKRKLAKQIFDSHVKKVSSTQP